MLAASERDAQVVPHGSRRREDRPARKVLAQITLHKLDGDGALFLRRTRLGLSHEDRTQRSLVQPPGLAIPDQPAEQFAVRKERGVHSRSGVGVDRVPWHCGTMGPHGWV